MAKLQYRDNAASLLTATVADTDTPATLSITSGSGAKFPTLTAGQWFPLVVVKVATLAYEKMRATARSSDSITATRAQGGTTALNFDIGDLVYLGSSAEFLDEFLLSEDAQAGKPHWLGVVSGTNTLTASATPTLTAYAAGQWLSFKADNANTGAVTLNIDGVGAADVLDAQGSALVAGALRADGHYLVQSDGTSFYLVNAGPFEFHPELASGDRLLFQQTTPGGSFVKDTGIQANTALRLVTGGVGSDLTGGTFTARFSSRTTTNQSSSHGHGFSVSGTTGNSGVSGSISGPAGAPLIGNHNHSFSDSGTTNNQNSSHNHDLAMDVDYYDATIGETT